jgi:hypothetical protein
MSKYTMMVRILDRIREDALETPHARRYNPPDTDHEKANQARSRAFIHLYLKVSFGLTDFREREHFVTDGSYDGGIDAYFIDTQDRHIYFIQSKFRTTEANFEGKQLALDEILVMDIERILSGEVVDEQGNRYNGKILGMARAISEISDIARYNYKVVLLANLEVLSQNKLRRLTGGYPVEVFNYDRCYQKLVFPVVSGTYFNASDLTIYIDLSNKGSGSKITYPVQMQHHECDVTVLFAPIKEIARLMGKYKNSILKYNPRSYLDFHAENVNEAIKNTILSTTGNEFALLNNGITVLSDETSINERIGQKNRAQLHVKNPQIINGGQTAYTLSRVYEECVLNGNADVFENKEVLVKIITLDDNQDTEDKLDLIEQISTATNQQTAVTNADRASNDKWQLEIQRIMFDRYGLLYERKLGEFGEGRHNGYVEKEQIVHRNMFIGIYLAANGDFKRKPSGRLFARYVGYADIAREVGKLDRFYWGYLCYKHLVPDFPRSEPSQRQQPVLLAKVYAITESAMPNDLSGAVAIVQATVSRFEARWADFVSTMAQKETKWLRTYTDKATNKSRTFFYEKGWRASSDFQEDVKNHFVRDSG